MSRSADPHTDPDAQDAPNEAGRDTMHADDEPTRANLEFVGVVRRSSDPVAPRHLGPALRRRDGGDGGEAEIIRAPRRSLRSPFADDALLPVEPGAPPRRPTPSPPARPAAQEPQRPPASRPETPTRSTPAPLDPDITLRVPSDIRSTPRPSVRSARPGRRIDPVTGLFTLLIVIVLGLSALLLFG